MSFPAGTALHLLIVDDNSSNLRIAQLLLAAAGHTAELADNAVTALEWLAERSYDAVLMDCQMPELDGYEATRLVRSGERPILNPRIPIIAVTAHALAGDRDKCLSAGMDDYVAKPVRWVELSAALQRQVSRPNMQSADTPSVLDHSALERARLLPGANGPSLLPELIGVYLAEQPGHLLRIGAAYHAQHLAELADQARIMAEAAGSFGAAAVRHSALGLERAARSADPAAIEAGWRELCVATAALRPALAELQLLPPSGA